MDAPLRWGISRSGALWTEVGASSVKPPTARSSRPMPGLRFQIVFSNAELARPYLCWRSASPSEPNAATVSPPPRFVGELRGWVDPFR